MRSVLKIIIGLIILLVSFDGLRISGATSLGPSGAILFALLGVAAPLVIGIYLKRPQGFGEAFANASVALWPLCIMRLWPIVAAMREWGYSYTLSAPESDVVGFILYLAAISLWAFLSASSLGRKAETSNANDNHVFTMRSVYWWGIVIGFVIILAVPLCLALIKHATFHSKAWDLAIFSQLAYNILHGNGLEVSVRGIASIFSDHFSPIMFPVAFLSQVFGGGAKGLIILQAIAIATGVIPVALISARRIPSNSVFGLIPPLIYALYVPLTFLLLDDFHPIAFVIPLILWAFYFLEIKRMWPFYIFLILAGCCQEEVWIIIGMVGLYLALFQRMRLAGIVLFICSWAFFFFLVSYFIPSFRPEGDYFYIHRYAYLGGSAGEIAKNIFIHPGLWLRRMFDARSIAFILMLLAPLGFLPLRRPKMLFILIPVAFYTLISGYDIQRTIFHQYVAPFIPFLILSTLDNFRQNSNGKLDPGKMQLALGGLWCGVCAMAMMLLFPIGGFPEIYGQGGIGGFDAKLNNHFLAQIAEEDKVCTISKYAPHLSNRRHLTLFPNLGWSGYWPDKILVDGKELVTSEDKQALAELLYGENDGPDYGLSMFYNGVFLFEANSDLPPWGRTIRASTPPLGGLIPAEGGEFYRVGIVKSGDLSPFTAGSDDIKLLAADIDHELYWLKLVLEVSGDFGHDRFFAVRCEDEAGNPLFVYPHFPIYGPFYDVELEPGETRPFRIFNKSHRIIEEAYVIDMAMHRPKPGAPFFDGKKAGLPARLRVLPTRLPDGWTNTLDEYVTAKEQTSGVKWENAFVIELGNSGR